MLLSLATRSREPDLLLYNISPYDLWRMNCICSEDDCQTQLQVSEGLYALGLSDRTSLSSICDDSTTLLQATLQGHNSHDGCSRQAATLQQLSAQRQQASAGCSSSRLVSGHQLRPAESFSHLSGAKWCGWRRRVEGKLSYLISQPMG